MADEYFVLSKDDARLIQRLLDEAKQRPKSTPQFTPQIESSQSPEVYIAKPRDVIDALIEQTCTEAATSYADLDCVSISGIRCVASSTVNGRTSFVPNNPIITRTMVLFWDSTNTRWVISVDGVNKWYSYGNGVASTYLSPLGLYSPIIPDEYASICVDMYCDDNDDECQGLDPPECINVDGLSLSLDSVYDYVGTATIEGYSNTVVGRSPSVVTVYWNGTRWVIALDAAVTYYGPDIEGCPYGRYVTTNPPADQDDLVPCTSVCVTSTRIGPDNERPGYATCNICKIVDTGCGPHLQLVGAAQRVYNITSTALASKTPILVVRDKFGSWCAVDGGGTGPVIVRFQVTDIAPYTVEVSTGCSAVTATVKSISCQATGVGVGDSITVYDPNMDWFDVPFTQLQNGYGQAIQMKKGDDDDWDIPDCGDVSITLGDCYWLVQHFQCVNQISP